MQKEGVQGLKTDISEGSEGLGLREKVKEVSLDRRRDTSITAKYVKRKG